MSVYTKLACMFIGINLLGEMMKYTLADQNRMIDHNEVVYSYCLILYGQKSVAFTGNVTTGSFS